jgi:hypothetical protein
VAMATDVDSKEPIRGARWLHIALEVEGNGIVEISIISSIGEAQILSAL